MFNNLKYKIRPLTVEDAKKAALLYAYCSRYDDYFRKKFGSDSVELDILKQFSPDVMNAIKHGNSLGCFYKDQLVGYLFAFSVMDWRNNHKEELERIFGDSDSFLDTVTTTVMLDKTDVMYMFAVGVSDNHRCRGIATNMIKKMVSLYGKDYTLFSDATHASAMPMWLSNGFIEMTVNDVRMVKR